MKPEQNDEFKDLVSRDLNNVLPQNIPDHLLDALDEEAEMLIKDNPANQEIEESIIFPMVLYICSKTGLYVEMEEEEELGHLISMYCCLRLRLEKEHRVKGLDIAMPTMQSLLKNDMGELYAISINQNGKGMQIRQVIKKAGDN